MYMYICMSIYIHAHFLEVTALMKATRNLQHPTIPTSTPSDAVDRWWATQRNH